LLKIFIPFRRNRRKKRLVLDVLGFLGVDGVASVLSLLALHVSGARATSDTAEDDAIQKGGAAETIVTVDTAGDLATSVKARDDVVTSGDLGPIAIQLGGALELSILVDHDTAHAVVNDGGDEGDVEGLVGDLARGEHVVEELLADAGLARGLIPGLSAGVGGEWAAFGVLVLLLGGNLMLGMDVDQSLDVAADLLGEVATGGEKLHDATALVMLAMPMNLVSGGLVEAETERSLALPHLAGDVIAAAELVGESVTVGVEEETTNTTEGLGGEELNLGVRVVRLDETGRVDLDPLQIDGGGAGGDAHLDAVTGAVLTVGGGQMHQIGAMLGEQGVVAEISTEAAAREDDGAVGDLDLLLVIVLATNNGGAVHAEFKDLSLVDDHGALALGVLLDLLEALHEGVCDSHTREAFLTTMGTGGGMTTETGDQREIELEFVDQPIDTRAGLGAQDLGDLGHLGATLEGIRSE